MEYTEEDYNFIKNWLNKCIKIEKNNIIYYVTSPNILRQLKYNKLCENNKEIKVDFTKLNFDDNIILKQDLKIRWLDVNYYKVWIFFENKYNCDFVQIKTLINNILCDILNLKEYTSDYYW